MQYVFKNLTYNVYKMDLSLLFFFLRRLQALTVLLFEI